MKYNEILTEAHAKMATIPDPVIRKAVDKAYLSHMEFTTNDHKQVANYILKNAQSWVSQVDPAKFILYRGISHTSQPMFIQGAPTNRKPKDTDSLRHKIFNAMIAGVGGYANRSNSIFTTRDREMAESFGFHYVTIPLGEFRYTYSPAWTDWTEEVAMPQIFMAMSNEAIRDLLVTLKALDAIVGWDQEVQKLLGKIDITNVKQIAAKRKKVQVFLEHSLGRGHTPRYNIPQVLNRRQIESIFLNPKSYDSKESRKLIVADRDLAALKRQEIMIAAPKVLYIDASLYKKVIPFLKK